MIVQLKREKSALCVQAFWWVRAARLHHFLRQCIILFCFFILSNVLDCRNLSVACASDSSKHPFEHKRNPWSQQSPEDSRQYKNWQQWFNSVNSTAFRKGTDKKSQLTLRFFQIESGRVIGEGGVIRPQRCTGVWVYKAALLCWAGRTPPAESGRWIWWRRRQGWRRPGHLLHTAGISGHGGESVHMQQKKKRRMWPILHMRLLLKMTYTLTLLSFLQF